LYPIKKRLTIDTYPEHIEGLNNFIRKYHRKDDNITYLAFTEEVYTYHSFFDMYSTGIIADQIPDECVIITYTFFDKDMSLAFLMEVP
jgi:uncharacterized Fe-S cluster-containing protein